MNTSSIDNDKTAPSVSKEFDYSRAAQLSATFSITMFLSLCLLVTKHLEGYEAILKVLWIASGLFGAAAMKFLDGVFDSATKSGEKRILATLLTIKSRAFISFDTRWQDIGFILYFLAWIFFFVAFYLLGLKLFSLDTPSNFSDFFTTTFSNMWMSSVILILMLSTIFAATYQFFFVD